MLMVNCVAWTLNCWSIPFGHMGLIVTLNDDEGSKVSYLVDVGWGDYRVSQFKHVNC